MSRFKQSLVAMCIFVLSGCVYPSQAAATQPQAGLAKQEPQTTVPASTATFIPMVKIEPTLAATLPQVSTPTPASAAVSAPHAGATAIGPDDFPGGVNPLTGLPVTNPDNLKLPPAFVSVTNFPTTARPQAGLSYSPFVFEMYIGEGMTRFLAMFYGNFPAAKNPSTNDANSKVVDDYSVGPIRSGRLPYESIRAQYGGFLVMASAWSGVASQLSAFTNVFGSDSSDVNSAMLRVTDLEKLAQTNEQRLKNTAQLSGLQFDSQAPAGGKNGQMIWIPYNFLNQVIWRYDAGAQGYTRYQDDADGKTFIQATDRLTQAPLAFQNVVILFANHHARAETLIDLDLQYQNPTPALIFRDGKMFEAFWTTQNADFEKKTGLLRPIRFVDAQGNPFPLRPGQTWVEIVPLYTPYYETVDSTHYLDLVKKETPGSGNWAVHFFAPKITGK